MATRRRPSSFSTPPPYNGNGNIYGYGDLPNTTTPSPIKEEEQSQSQQAELQLQLPNGDDHDDDDKKKHTKKPPASKARAMMTLFLMNLAVILVFCYMRLPQRDLSKSPALLKFLDETAPHRMLGQDYVVIVTASTTHAGGTAVRIGRSNVTAVAALQDATQQLTVFHHNHYYYQWFKIDVVTGIQRLENFQYNRPFSPQFGDFFGIALGWDEGNVFLPDTVRAHSMVDSESFLRWERLIRHVEKNHPSSLQALVPDYGDDAEYLEVIDLFHTKAVLVDMSDTRHHSSAAVVPLQRGHRLFHDAELSPHVLRQAAIDASKYLLQTTDVDGHLVSYYQPRSHVIEYSHSSSDLWYGNSMMLVSLAQLHSVWNDAHLLERLHVILATTLSPMTKCRMVNGNSKVEAKCLVEEDGSSRLSTNAMLLLALTEFTDTTGGSAVHMETITALANYLDGMHVGTPDMQFIQRVVYDQSQVTKDLTYDEEESSEAQASYALLRLVNVLQKYYIQDKYAALWKETATTTVEALVSREDLSQDFVPDPWLLLAISQLYQMHRHSEPMVQYALAAAKFSQKYQIKTKPPPDQHPDLWGSYSHDSSATTSAEQSLGLCSVLGILSRAERPKALKSLRLSMQYQLQFQIRPETAMYLRDPQRILGGMHDGVSFSMSNVDSSLHIMSFLCVANNL